MERIINQIILGDCLEKMKELPDNSIDAIITDPPYYEIKGGFDFIFKSFEEYIFCLLCIDSNVDNIY